MTYSIIARCPQTGRLGIGITTYSIAVGGRCEGIRADVGICKTQAFTRRANDPMALDLLARGYTPARVMGELAENDPDHEYRQIAILDYEGNAAAHSGTGTRPWSGHLIGSGYVAFGNVLAGAHVVDAIAAGFTADPTAPLEFRLLTALEAGRDAGGQTGGERGRKPREAVSQDVFVARLERAGAGGGV
jgi:uncharacterized Ntn-hydrolase superfamily protein